MEEQRPDPDKLLDKVRRDTERGREGRLKVFFGAAPGVGKTYAMLEARARSMPKASTSSSGSWRRMDGKRPLPSLKGWRCCRGAASSTGASISTSSISTRLSPQAVPYACR